MQPIPFGKYLLVERLAQGGMAEVFRAVFSGAAGFEKQVAVKRILPIFDGAQDFVTMFVDEARIASSLTHVNIVQVFDFGEHDGSYYLAMELIDGVDLGRLREAAARRGLRLPVAVAAFIVAEAARGLAYAHDRRGADGASLGIVHRDVSPHNVLVSYAGEVKIADFGIAKATGKLHKTDSGAVMGKIRYMSPEQIAGEPLDGRSDLFALAVILWELLAGEPLWPGDNPGAVADQVRHWKIEPPSRRQREVPAELDRIVMRGLERGRDARPARAAELARELSAWLTAAAPSLTREDVGAFVAEVVPRADGEPLVLAHAPTVATPRSMMGSAAGTAGTGSPGSSGGRDGLSPLGLPSLPGGTPALTATLPGATDADSGAGAAAETRIQKRTGTGSQTGATTPDAATTAGAARSRAAWIVGGVGAALLLGGGGVGAWRWLHAAAPLAGTVDGGARDAGPGTSSDDGGAALPVVSAADRLRMVAELEALPRAESTWRGVMSPDFLAVLSAVDGALCATPAGAREPLLSATARTRVEGEQLLPETLALGRYLLATGELPPRVAGALQSFLHRSAAWSLVAAPGSGGQGWSLARLGALVSPADGKARLDVIRQNGALAAWREPGRERALPFAELCERAPAVAAYATRAPGPRAEALRRFQRATPPELPADDGGLRYSVSGAERDEAAGTLLVYLRVTNTSSEDKPLALGQLRLAGLEAVAPSVDPPAAQLGAGQVRELRIGFSGVTDDLAEAAVLVVRPGVELQAYSEALR